MVRFFNKNLKSHYYEGGEKTSDLIEFNKLFQLTQLLTLHTRHFGSWSNDELIHLLQKLNVQLGINEPKDYWDVLYKQRTKLKDLFLTFELILESFSVTLKYQDHDSYFLDFVNDVNEFFLINKVPLQIRFLPQNNDYFVEKVISPEVSEKIKETLNAFSKEEKVFEDFKEAIKKYSAGDFEGSIEKCCVTIEDYLCILLEKGSCSKVNVYYNEVSKKLNIPSDLNDRFSNIINFIHKHRSPQNHGSIQKVKLPEPELTTEVIIQFTMVLLLYLKKKNLLEVKK